MYCSARMPVFFTLPSDQKINPFKKQLVIILESGLLNCQLAIFSYQFQFNKL
jgi:hypothetical protein